MLHSEPRMFWRVIKTWKVGKCSFVITVQGHDSREHILSIYTIATKSAVSLYVQLYGTGLDIRHCGHLDEPYRVNIYCIDVTPNSLYPFKCL